jgi:probable HAF family extracellular repeat protein
MLVGGKAAIAGYVFTTIDSPDLFDTAVWGINDSGQIVGNSGGSGFLYTGGSFTTINVPGAYRTFAYGINNSGQIVGDYLVGSRQHGFLYTGGSFTTIPDIPGGFTVGAQGINDSGQIVGGYEGSSSSRSFLYTGGSFTTINVPGATEAPIANGINDSGQIVGTYSDFVCSVGNVPLACSGGEHGFLDTGGSFTTIDFPGAESTFAVGINDSGQIGGGPALQVGRVPPIAEGSSLGGVRRKTVGRKLRLDAR